MFLSDKRLIKTIRKTYHLIERYCVLKKTYNTKNILYNYTCTLCNESKRLLSTHRLIITNFIFIYKYNVYLAYVLSLLQIYYSYYLW